MPMFNFRCEDCKFGKEHFVYSGKSLDDRICPKCGSNKYKRLFSLFRARIEYNDPAEHMEKVINPGVDEIHQQIGREALDEDAATLENVFGDSKVKNTLAETDD